MSKIILGLVGGALAFLAGIFLPLLLFGILFFMVPHQFLELYFKFGVVLAFVYGYLMTYRVTKRSEIAILGMLINLSILSALNYPKYSTISQQSAFAMSPTADRITFPEFMISMIVPFDSDKVTPYPRDYSYDNNLKSFANELTPPPLPADTQWSEIPLSEWEPALLKYQHVEENETKQYDYDEDGSVPITGKLWVSEPLKRRYRDPSGGLSSQSSVQDKIYAYIQKEVTHQGWHHAQSGVTYQGKVKYLTNFIDFKNIIGCSTSHPYVGLSETSMRIIHHISESPTCRQGDPVYNEYREYIFVSDELMFEELERMQGSR